MNLQNLSSEGLRFKNELEQLTTAKKNIITDLTTLADTFKGTAAREICDILEHRIYTVTPVRKLYTLYLIDSICKFVKNPYNILFSQRIFDIFRYLYTQSSEGNLRASLKETFYTWQDAEAGEEIFPRETLNKIDDLILKIIKNDRSSSTPDALLYRGRQLLGIILRLNADLDQLRKESSFLVKSEISRIEGFEIRRNNLISKINDISDLLEADLNRGLTYDNNGFSYFDDSYNEIQKSLDAQFKEQDKFLEQSWSRINKIKKSQYRKRVKEEKEYNRRLYLEANKVILDRAPKMEFFPNSINQINFTDFLKGFGKPVTKYITQFKFEEDDNRREQSFASGFGNANQSIGSNDTSSLDNNVVKVKKEKESNEQPTTIDMLGLFGGAGSLILGSGANAIEENSRSNEESNENSILNNTNSTINHQTVQNNSSNDMSLVSNNSNGFGSSLLFPTDQLNLNSNPNDTNEDYDYSANYPPPPKEKSPHNQFVAIKGEPGTFEFSEPLSSNNIVDQANEVYDISSDEDVQSDVEQNYSDSESTVSNTSKGIESQSFSTTANHQTQNFGQRSISNNQVHLDESQTQFNQSHPADQTQELKEKEKELIEEEKSDSSELMEDDQTNLNRLGLHLNLDGRESSPHIYRPPTPPNQGHSSKQSSPITISSMNGINKESDSDSENDLPPIAPRPPTPPQVAGETNAKSISPSSNNESPIEESGTLGEPSTNGLDQPNKTIESFSETNGTTESTETNESPKSPITQPSPSLGPKKLSFSAYRSARRNSDIPPPIDNSTGLGLTFGNTNNNNNINNIGITGNSNGLKSILKKNNYNNNNHTTNERRFSEEIALMKKRRLSLDDEEEAENPIPTKRVRFLDAL
ncbi:PCF11 [Candida jiufengensis]|uniref:PCF11 n=1 Tax=Candida jiufengensis TaxID=497108 RepID=UPI0022252B59|nr:PCF11 [Candida jiufengensis]KAI5951859.1 PCF11 [Candida jiufengensis]